MKLRANSKSSKVKPVRKNRTDLRSNTISALSVSLVIAVCGLILAWHDVSEAYDDRRLIAEGTQVSGVITDVKFDIYKNRGDRSKKTVTVSYKADRSTYIVESEMDYRERREGTTLTVEKNLINTERNVFYDADDPSNSVVQGWEDSLIGAYLYGGFFIILGLGGAVISIRFIKLAKSKNGR